MWSEKEIELAKELKRLGLEWTPRRGHYVFARHCPAGCLEIAESVFLVADVTDELTDFVWLPTFDDLLEVARTKDVSFSFITDFCHRRRFADRAEREGFYQLLVERMRA
jgi:hypothetical protein